MDTSRRAVESYWRSRMIDAATSDEDKVTPVYKLEEICELLRSSHVSIVKEVSDFVLKRLDHKSPIVKQKALRLIKYAVGKSGVEFRREMQRHSVAVRQLFHYKGQLDPLKGDALNKAVRDTAHEAISAIFSEDNKPAPAEDLNRRIQGFGNTNYEVPSDDKKSFLSEVVGLGSASIKQGLSSFTQGHSFKKNDTGSYKSPNLHRSLTTESESRDRYEPAQYHSEAQGSFGISKNATGGPWNQDSRLNKEFSNEDSSSSHTGSKTHEERLLETIVTSGGVRLQPTRDAIQVFLGEAAKLDALALSRAVESKLQSPMWQVRMKAVCVLESILRKKDDDHFSVIGAYFSERKDAVARCSESPQASLREKANKVLSLLGGEQAGSAASSEKLVKAETTTFQMPDLIDTGDSDDYHGTDSTNNISDHLVPNPTTQPPPLIDDLFGDGFDNVASSSDLKNDDDPFSDVSFHGSGSREHGDDLFSGMTIDGGQDTNENQIAAGKKDDSPEVFDIFGSISVVPQEQVNQEKNVNDLLVGLSINENGSKMKQKGTSSAALSEAFFSGSSTNSSHQVSNDAFSSNLAPQTAGMNANFIYSQGAMPYNVPPAFMFNQAFPSQQINYGAMGNVFAQHLATMSHLGNLNAQNTGVGLAAETMGGYATPLPDIFQPNYPTPAPNSMMNNSSKKEETKAFDFISDHVAAARDPKRVV